LLKETPEAFAFARRLQRQEPNCLEALMEALNERGECEKRAPEHRVTSASGGRREPFLVIAVWSVARLSVQNPPDKVEATIGL